MRIASSVTEDFSLFMDRALADAAFLAGDLTFLATGFPPLLTGAAPFDGAFSSFSFLAFFAMA
jgi:hypothetical protein